MTRQIVKTLIKRTGSQGCVGKRYNFSQIFGPARRQVTLENCVCKQTQAFTFSPFGIYYSECLSLLLFVTFLSFRKTFYTGTDYTRAHERRHISPYFKTDTSDQWKDTENVWWGDVCYHNRIITNKWQRQYVIMHFVMCCFWRGLQIWPPCFSALRRKTTKTAIRALESGFLNSKNLHTKNKLSTFTNWTVINVTSA